MQQRYFCFFYTASTDEQNSRIQGKSNDFGLITMESKDFPSHIFVKNYVRKARYNKGWMILLTNMYEFKSKEDYDNFNQQQVIVHG